MPTPNYKAHLNAEQLQAAEAMVLVSVCAGAGTGKTATQTASIIDKIEAQGIAPDRIIALTFTNKASREMKERIRSFGVKPPTYLGTFHSVCIKLLRSFPELADGINVENLNILDPDLAIPFVIQHIISRIPESAYEKLRKIHQGGSFRSGAVLTPTLLASSFISFLSTMRAEGLDVDDIRTQDHLHSLGDTARLTIEALHTNPVGFVLARKFSDRYAEIKATSNTMDFDDLISVPVRTLGRDAKLRRLVASYFDSVFVDEDQDTNVPQDRLVRYLSGSAKCVFRVGDVRQGIYGWRGSRTSLLLGFAREAEENGTVVYLSQNYRSTQQILDTATRILRHDRQSPKDGLVAARRFSDEDSHTPVFMTEYATDQTELRLITQSIRSRTERGESPGSFAIITRTNQVASAFYLRLLAAKVPVSCDAVELFRTLVIRFIVGYAMFLTEPENPLNVMRIGDLFANKYAPKWSLGEKTRGEMQLAISETGSTIKGLRKFLESANPRYLKNVGEKIEELLAERESLEEFMSSGVPGGGPNPYTNAKQVFAIADDAGGIRYGVTQRINTVRQQLEQYNSMGNATRYANDVHRLEKELNTLEEVMERLDTFFEATGDLSVRDAIEAVTLGSRDADEKEKEEQDTVRVMTIHKSKGLEFDNVFLPTLTTGALFREHDEGSPEYEEAIRCLYVGMTRARKELRMSVPKAVRGRPSKGFPKALSSLTRLPDVHHYEEVGGILRRRYGTPAEEGGMRSDDDEDDYMLPDFDDDGRGKDEGYDL